jgi:hypothetical protein
MRRLIVPRYRFGILVGYETFAPQTEEECKQFLRERAVFPSRDRVAIDESLRYLGLDALVDRARLS